MTESLAYEVPVVPTTACVQLADRPWVTTPRGNLMRLLRVSADAGTWVVHNRFAPGTVTRTHRHTGLVHAFTLRGRWAYLEYDFVAEAGSYVHEMAGATHTLVVPEDNVEETEVVFVVEGANLYLGDDGRVVGYQDGHQILADYVRYCAEQGHPYPAGVVG